jgi:hypothetical protein
MENVDGTYSVAAAAAAGTSFAICVIDGGKLHGNDIGGGRYLGTVVVQDGSVSFDVDLTMPPDGALIWSTATTETWQTRTIKHSVTVEEWRSGKPIYMRSEGMYLIFTRIRDAWAAGAGPDGFAMMSAMLANADKLWRQRDGR